MRNKRDEFTEAHNDYYPLVFSAVFTKVDNIDDVQDICQEVFIKFYEKLDEIENRRKWLYGALRLAVLEHYRKKRGSDIDINEVFDDVSLTFVNGFRDARIIIGEAIENSDFFTDDLAREVFDYIAVYNYSYKEAGRHLGLSKRQVEYKYRRVVDAILNSLREKGIKHIEDLL
jgi:RNA polymerase sigma factor (sigma-70 family)